VRLGGFIQARKGFLAMMLGQLLALGGKLLGRPAPAAVLEPVGFLVYVETTAAVEVVFVEADFVFADSVKIECGQGCEVPAATGATIERGPSAKAGVADRLHALRKHSQEIGGLGLEGVHDAQDTNGLPGQPAELVGQARSPARLRLTLRDDKLSNLNLDEGKVYDSPRPCSGEHQTYGGSA
jgi:hypothetical protein